MNKYDAIIRTIFADHYRSGSTTLPFAREELLQKAALLGIEAPKNLGDIVYSYKYRASLPDEISSTAPEGFYWRIRIAGKSRYEFTLEAGPKFIEPDVMLSNVKIPDSTPSIVRKYSLSDEQALLTLLRYNRLIDTFLGITCYSLQNHLRTTVSGIGQIETDELYLGVDKKGRQFIIPVQAKGGSDKIGISQIEQDMALCEERFPALICRPVACQFLSSDTVAIFEFAMEDGRIVKCDEKHYKIMEASEISMDDLQRYQKY